MSRARVGPFHSHDLGDELFLILQGQCEFAIDDDRAVLGPGQLCVARAGQKHEVRVIGDEPMTMFLVVAPHIEPTHTFWARRRHSPAGAVQPDDRRRVRRGRSLRAGPRISPRRFRPRSASSPPTRPSPPRSSRTRSTPSARAARSPRPRSTNPGRPSGPCTSSSSPCRKPGTPSPSASPKNPAISKADFVIRSRPPARACGCRGRGSRGNPAARRSGSRSRRPRAA